jgi:hypothetical protein
VVKTEFIGSDTDAELHVTPSCGGGCVYIHSGPPPNPMYPGARAVVCLDADAADALAGELRAAAAQARRSARIGFLHSQLTFALAERRKPSIEEIGAELVTLGGQDLRDAIGALAAGKSLGRAALLVHAWNL